MANVHLRRHGLLPTILIPQALLLGMFLFHHYAVWGKLTGGLAWSVEGVSLFFFELVTHGAGWAALSLSLLALSLAFYESGGGAFYAKFIEERFERASAMELVEALKREASLNRILGRVSFTLFFLITLVGALSLVGGHTYAASVREGLESISLSFTMIGAFAVSLFSLPSNNRIGSESDEFGLEEVARQGGLFRGWSPAEFVAWEAVDAAGRLNHPGVKALYDHRRTECLKDDKFAAELTTFRAQA